METWIACEMAYNNGYEAGTEEGAEKATNNTIQFLRKKENITVATMKEIREIGNKIKKK